MGHQTSSVILIRGSFLVGDVFLWDLASPSVRLQGAGSCSRQERNLQLVVPFQEQKLERGRGVPELAAARF